MSDSERAIRDRIARLTELIAQLDDDATWLHQLAVEHYERLARVLAAEEAV